MKETGRILLAEDDPSDVVLTLAALAEHGLDEAVVVVRDGTEVLDYLYRRGPYADVEGPPLLLLLDLKMPKLDGIEVLQRIKSDERLRTVPVVMLTSSRESTDLEKCYRLGVNAYVVKPVRFDDFAEAVKLVGRFWLINEPPPGTPRLEAGARAGEGAAPQEQGGAAWNRGLHSH